MNSQFRFTHASRDYTHKVDKQIDNRLFSYFHFFRRLNKNMEIEPIHKKPSVDARNANNRSGLAFGTSKIVKRPVTASAASPNRLAKSLANKTKATTTTVTKITKLVLKPRAEPKSRFTLTTTQHFSRQTATSSSMKTSPNPDKTYRVRNINAMKRVSTDLTKRSLAQKAIKNKPEISSKENESTESKKQEVVVKSNAEIQLNQTKTLNNGILEEITSAVVNTSQTNPTSARNSMAFEIQNTPKKRNKPSATATTEKSPEKCKRKSYDPIKARQFIREQQEKRKLSALEKAKASVNQEEIKKRLDNLRRNSLKIVNKNVKKARNSTPEVEKKGKVELRRKSETVARISQTKSSKLSAEPRPSNASSVAIMSQQSQRERIGLLRRPEGLEDGTIPNPIQITTPLARGNNTRSKMSPQLLVGESPAEALNETPRAAPNADPKMDLQMPLSMSLKSSLLMANLATPKDNRSNEMRFWLRPTPVQPYPYNFIMAVRKKLELVTHPVLKPSNSVSTSHSMAIENNYYDESIKQASAKDHLKSQESLNSEVVARASHSESDHSKVRTAKNNSYSEEYSTNFSSVTLKTLDRSQMQANEMLSSTKISTNRLPVANEDSQDTLSISSGILSHSSPEKKRNILKNKIVNTERLPTPLSTNHADSLRIVSRSISQHSSSANGQTHGSGDASKPLNVQKMLDDFNQSLSQVIRVNQQLHTALSNPPSLRPASVSEQQSTEEYSDDVDNFASDRPTNEKTAIEEQTPSTATPSTGPIATDGESIPESITATHSELERRQSSTLKESEGITKSSMAEEVPTTASVRSSHELQTQIVDGSQSQPQSTRSFQKSIFNEREVMNTSIGSDIFTILNQTAAVDLNTSTWSEGNVSYSNLGMVNSI